MACELASQVAAFLVRAGLLSARHLHPPIPARSLRRTGNGGIEESHEELVVCDAVSLSAKAPENVELVRQHLFATAQPIVHSLSCGSDLSSSMRIKESTK